jgi:hypothetical protein
VTLLTNGDTVNPDSLLRYFRDQPLSHPGKQDVHLMVWYYEDWLKKFFFSLLQTLEVRSTLATGALITDDRC